MAYIPSSVISYAFLERIVACPGYFFADTSYRGMLIGGKPNLAAQACTSYLPTCPILAEALCQHHIHPFQVLKIIRESATKSLFTLRSTSVRRFAAVPRVGLGSALLYGNNGNNITPPRNNVTETNVITPTSGCGGQCGSRDISRGHGDLQL